jgi:hypothetical protein
METSTEASVIIALVGVVAGGLLTGAVQTWLNWRDRVRETRSAARLLFADYVRAVAALKSLVEIEVWWSDDLAPPLDDWRSRRAALAGAMDGEAWTTVDGAFTQLADLEASRQAHAAIEGESPLTADSTAVEEADEALHAMTAAGGELLVAGFTRREIRRWDRRFGDAPATDDGLALAIHQRRTRRNR